MQQSKNVNHKAIDAKQSSKTKDGKPESQQQ